MIKTLAGSLVCVLCGVFGVLHTFGWEGEQAFGIKSPVEVAIIAWQADGTLVWANAATGATATIFRTSNLRDDAARKDFMEVLVTDDVMAVQVVVLKRPTLDEAARSEMVTIPGGTFLRGDTKGDTWLPSSDELPTHSVTVDTFQMGRYPVTKAEWDEVYAWAVARGYRFDYDGADGTEALKPPDHPVGAVTWFDAVKWCNAKSEKEGLTPCYTVDGEVFRTGTDDPDCDWTADGYRLPTEAEWEYAARGGLAGRRFPWGDRISHFHANYEVHLVDDGSFHFPYDDGPTGGYHPDYADFPLFFLGNPVNAFPPNGYGLHDMAGNHWNWCWDWYDAAYYEDSPAGNPRGPDTGTERASRGGEMIIFGAGGCRVSNRLSTPPGSATYACGFRLVRSHDAAAEPPAAPPAAPGNLTAEAVSSSQINLAWTANSDNEDDFEIQRKTGAGSFAAIAVVAAGTTGHHDTGLDPETAYTYRVRARNAAGESDWSNEAGDTTFAPPGPSIVVLIDDDFSSYTIDSQPTNPGDGNAYDWILSSNPYFDARVIAGASSGSHTPGHVLHLSYDGPNRTSAGGVRSGFGRRFETAGESEGVVSVVMEMSFLISGDLANFRHRFSLGILTDGAWNLSNVNSSTSPGGAITRDVNRFQVSHGGGLDTFTSGLRRDEWYLATVEFHFVKQELTVLLENLSDPAQAFSARTYAFNSSYTELSGFAQWPASSDDLQLDHQIGHVRVTAVMAGEPPGEPYEPAPTPTAYVTDFGAVGDGISNDRQAFLDAIASFGAGGGVLGVPAGTYLLAGDINVEVPIVFVGDGPQRTILTSGFSSTRIRVFESGTEFWDMGFERMVEPMALHSRADYVLRDLRFQRCRFEDIVVTDTNRGVIGLSSGSSPQRPHRIRYVTIKDCVFRNIDSYAVKIRANISEVRIQNCRFENIVNLRTEAPLGGAAISLGNSADDAGELEVYADMGFNLIAGNIIRNVQKRTPGGTLKGILMYGNYNIIRGNLIEDIDGTPQGDDVNAMYFRGAFNEIYDNEIRNITGADDDGALAFKGGLNLGSQGHVVYRNRIENINGMSGVEASTDGLRFFENVMINAAPRGFDHRSGTGLFIENNLFIHGEIRIRARFGEIHITGNHCIDSVILLSERDAFPANRDGVFIHDNTFERNVGDLRIVRGGNNVEEHLVSVAGNLFLFKDEAMGSGHIVNLVNNMTLKEAYITDNHVFKFASQTLTFHTDAPVQTIQDNTFEDWDD